MALRTVSAKDWFEQHANQVGNTEHHLWGPHIRKEAVTLFVGETSVGKTTLLYNLCYKLSMGESFLGTQPDRPLRILHCDYEIDDATRLDTMCKIGFQSDNWEFLRRDECGGDLSGPGLFHELESIEAGRYDVLIVDPLCDAYPVKNENDNEEANVQMRRFRALARAKHMGVVLVHNTGRPHFNPKTGEQNAFERASKKHMGRGATARADRADVGINYVAVDKTTRLMCVAKSRTPGHLGYQWLLDFDGNHGYKVRSTEYSHSHASQTPPVRENENETEALTAILHEHAGKDLKSIYELHVSGVLEMSRATFYRKVQLIRTQPMPPVTSSE